MIKPRIALATAAMAILLAGCGPSLELADDQQQFVTLVEESRKAYNDADNSIQEGRAREARAADICSHFADGFGVKDWQGQIDGIYSTMTEDVGIDMLIAKNVTLQTASSSLTFDNETQKTLITKESPLYEIVAGLKQGDTVKFSGAFLEGSEKDCLMEVSVTQAGGMKMPEFMFHVTDLEKEGE